jgi:hypothetical protein
MLLLSANRLNTSLLVPECGPKALAAASVSGLLESER